MNTTTQINVNRLLLLKKLFELRDIVININESQMLLKDKLKTLEYKKEENVDGKNKLLENSNESIKSNNAFNFIKSEDFKRLCIAAYCNLHNSFSYTLCQYENHSGMWCLTGNDQEIFHDNNSIMNYIRDLTSKYGFEILDFINTIEREKHESFNLSYFMIDELNKPLQEKIQSYYKSKLSNMVEDYNEEMKMQVTFRPDVPYESCSAYRRKQVDLVDGVSKLKDELKEKLERLIYAIPEQFIKEENLTRIQSYYLMKFQESAHGKRLSNSANNVSIVESKNASLADRKDKVISKYCTLLPSKYIFNEYALNCFIQYIYYGQAENVEECINIFEHKETQEDVIEQTISFKHVVDNLKDSVVNQLSKINIKLDNDTQDYI
ncbi:hypothetical protein I6U48_11130 [Clostridium sp. PL3]|uniref:Uncharacterized protein n=1 Tax=Clostridium thailandense TaxID=2794346 RepID=A0A949TU42_9CLOT|nr:hypothetical protein [Clostridium thailandense]MBV7273461.1 hypothetical protein [Clostridium thailandense]